MAEDHKPEILILWKSGSSNEEARSRLLKAVQAFSVPKEVDCTSFPELKAAIEAFPQRSATFVDHQLLQTLTDGELNELPGITVLFDRFNDLPENLRIQNREFPVLEILNLPTPDLLRILHFTLLPKRQSGIASLMEKGTIILGEKVQSLDTIGEILDRTTQFFSEQLPETAPLHSSFRLMALSLIQEAFERAQQQDSPYPTVDFQTSATREKIAFTLRIPSANKSLASQIAATSDSSNFSWFTARRHSSAMLLVEYPEFKETEVATLLFAQHQTSAQTRASLLSSTRKSGTPTENLLSAPKNYKFSLVSELAHKRLDANKYSVTTSIKELEKDMADAQLPEKLKLRIQQIEQDRANLQDLVQSRETQMRENQSELNKFRQDVSQKRNEILRLMKESEGSASKYRHRISDLEKRIEYHVKEITTLKSGARAAATGDANSKHLEGIVKTLEHEKTVLTEKVGQEQKRILLLEKKSAGLYRDLGERDKEIQQLKEVVHRAEVAASTAAREPIAKPDQKKGSVEAAMEAAKSQSNGAEAKLKDAEAREAALKQEVKKLALKIDTSEKNLKVIQTESAEKAKLLERKLEAAKAKEIELLKKVEELTALLKKATKAA